MLPGAEPESDAARVHSCTLRRFHGDPEANTRDHRGRTPRLCAKAISGGSGVASCIHWTTAAARSGPSPRIMRQQR